MTAPRASAERATDRAKADYTSRKGYIMRTNDDSLIPVNDTTTAESTLDYWQQHHTEFTTLVATLTPESALAVLRFTAQECFEGTYLAAHLLGNIRGMVARQAT